MQSVNQQKGVNLCMHASEMVMNSATDNVGKTIKGT